MVVMGFLKDGRGSLGFQNRVMGFLLGGCDLISGNALLGSPMLEVERATDEHQHDDGNPNGALLELGQTEH